MCVGKQKKEKNIRFSNTLAGTVAVEHFGNNDNHLESAI